MFFNRYVMNKLHQHAALARVADEAHPFTDNNVPSPEPRRVLFVENGIGYGGAVICLRHLVRHMDRTRYLPLVVTGRGGPLYAGIADDADWVHIPDRYLDLSGWKSRLERNAAVKKVPGSYGPLNQVIARSDDLFNFLPFFVRLLALTRRWRPAIIHLNNEPMCNRAGLLVGKLLGVPVVCHVRGDPSDQGGWFVRWLYGLPDHFAPVSHWVSEGIAHMGVGETRCTVVYDGIALADLNVQADGKAFRDQFGVPEDAFAVGLVGMLVPWKGQHIFIDAALRLRGEIPNLRMLLVGSAPDDCVDYAREVRRRVVAEGLEQTVIFTDHVKDMAGAYNGLDVVVSASTSPEPLGTVVIEALAMGRPLIVPSHGGGAEMVEDRRTGLVFHAGDAQSLAENILTFWRDPQLRQDLGRAARKTALETFDVETHVRIVQGIYESLRPGE